MLRGSKGGCSIYVPESYDHAKQYPLIFALHGGAGHGRGFLWSWLREARARGCIVISATATDDTWGLMQPQADSLNMERMVSQVSCRWNVDPTRRLLTGMSDGGTFTYVSGLNARSCFTHLAPIAASFHPLMLEIVGDTRAHGLPIHITHGQHDWMSPIDVARTAHATLNAAGAAVVLREIDDLAHTLSA